MLEVRVEGHMVYIGERFWLSFQRTLRVPNDGREYPLPPGLGAFPMHRVEDYLDRAPTEWKEAGGIFIPMYQREALWLLFGGAYWKPNAVKVGIGNINALSGKPLDTELRADPQDYMVCPDQPWLDGIRAEKGRVRQFAAMPLGRGYTVEEQLTGREEFGGIQVLTYEPRPGIFPDEPPYEERGAILEESLPVGSTGQMGLGAGGNIRQKIYPDKYGVGTWDTANYGSVSVYIVNSEQYRALTGHEPPPTPVSARYYTDMGLPWFDLYDESKGDVGPSRRLAAVKSVRQKDIEADQPPDMSDSGIEISPAQVKKLPMQGKGAGKREKNGARRQEWGKNKEEGNNG